MVRHAQASQAWLSLGYGDGQVRLSVADDGTGDPAVAARYLRGGAPAPERSGTGCGTWPSGPPSSTASSGPGGGAAAACGSRCPSRAATAARPRPTLTPHDQRRRAERGTTTTRRRRCGSWSWTTTRSSGRGCARSWTLSRTSRWSARRRRRTRRWRRRPGCAPTWCCSTSSSATARRPRAWTCAPRCATAARGVSIVVLTTFLDERLLVGALRRGASGYALKDVDAVELARIIRSRAPRAVRVRLAQRRPGRPLADRPARRRRPGLLSERELEVVRPVARGATNPQVARELYLSASPRSSTTCGRRCASSAPGIAPSSSSRRARSACSSRRPLPRERRRSTVRTDSQPRPFGLILLFVRAR